MELISSPEDRAGLLVAVISGGRRTLAERPTHKFLPALQEMGLNAVVWCVSDRDAAVYEKDEHEQIVYPQSWAFDYAVEHWTDVHRPPTLDGVLGPFPGREWACLEAERRGCWGVLQLDDNLIQISVVRGGGAAARYCYANGGLALHVDLLIALSRSTNAAMLGAHLQSAARERAAVCRSGFPYSEFIEKVGPGRAHWYGPSEDDIIQAFQYGTGAADVTSGVTSLIRYMKESQSKTGLRAFYDSTRAAQLQAMFPESANIRVMATMSNGRGKPRVFHKMARGAIRNPLKVTDPAQFAVAKRHVERILVEWHAADLASTRVKVGKRVAAGQIAGASKIAAPDVTSTDGIEA